MMLNAFYGSHKFKAKQMFGHFWESAGGSSFKNHMQREILNVMLQCEQNMKHTPVVDLVAQCACFGAG